MSGLGAIYLNEHDLNRMMMSDLGPDFLGKLTPAERHAARAEYLKAMNEARAKRDAEFARARGIHHTAQITFQQIHDELQRKLHEKLRSHGVSGLAGLGDIIETATSLAKTIGTMVQGGEIPKDVSAVNQAIDLAASVYAERLKQEALRRAAAEGTVPAGTPPSPYVQTSVTPPAAGLPGWVIPLGIAAVVLAVGVGMGRK